MEFGETGSILQQFTETQINIAKALFKVNYAL
jgi:hypothetical protein